MKTGVKIRHVLRQLTLPRNICSWESSLANLLKSAKVQRLYHSEECKLISPVKQLAPLFQPVKIELIASKSCYKIRRDINIAISVVTSKNSASSWEKRTKKLFFPRSDIKSNSST